MAPWSIASLVCPTTFELYSSIEFPFSWCGRAFSLQCIKKLRSLLYMFWPKRVKLVPSALWVEVRVKKAGWGWAIGHVTLATTINNLSERLNASMCHWPQLHSIAFLDFVGFACRYTIDFIPLSWTLLHLAGRCVVGSQFSSRFCSSNSNQWSEDVRST